MFTCIHGRTSNETCTACGPTGRFTDLRDSRLDAIEKRLEAIERALSERTEPQRGDDGAAKAAE